jgi:hypothetical protein
MARLESPRRAAVVASELLLSVCLFNVVELAAFPWAFPGIGLLAVFGLAGLGALALLSAVVLAPVSDAATVTSCFAFGVVLTAGFVPAYLAFGCVFYGCAG